MKKIRRIRKTKRRIRKMRNRTLIAAVAVLVIAVVRVGMGVLFSSFCRYDIAEITRLLSKA